MAASNCCCLVRGLSMIPLMQRCVHVSSHHPFVSAYMSTRSMAAHDRFFSIDELVELFLIHAEPSVLLNCQRVCQRWNLMIKYSKALQDPVRINPILTSHFAPLLDCQPLTLSQDSVAIQSRVCTYTDLSLTKWFRDGAHANAPARLAFARKEASWRKMIISQPPITRLDWWHSWESFERSRQYDHPLLNGVGHEYYNEPLTLGFLWDWIEARLVRGCSAQVTFFLAGHSTIHDPSALREEKGWDQRATPFALKKYAPTRPRLRVHSWQVWPGAAPSMYQEYDVAQRLWRIQDELPFVPETENQKSMYKVYNQNGWAWLLVDLRRDSKPDCVESMWRWSKSDGMDGVQLCRAGGQWGGRTHEATQRRQELMSTEALS